MSSREYAREELVVVANDISDLFEDDPIDVSDKRDANYILEEIKSTAASIEVSDKEQLRKETWAFLKREKLGPFAELASMPNRKPHQDPEDVEETDEDTQDDEGDNSDAEETTSKKGAKKTMATKDTKKAGKAGKSEKKEKAPKGPGVIGSIIDILQKATKPMTKEEILHELSKRLPDREATSMKNTLNVQLPNRINKERDFKVEHDANGGWFIVGGKAGAKAKTEKPAKASKEKAGTKKAPAKKDEGKAKTAKAKK